MATELQTRHWITGEEFAAERARLREQGCGPDSPQYRALLQRVRERNEYVWSRYAIELVEQHRGKWAAIALNGDYILAESELEALRRGRERFGPANSAIVRLDETRGAHRIGPRSG